MIGGEFLEPVTPADEDLQARADSVTLADAVTFMSTDTVVCNPQPKPM